MEQDKEQFYWEKRHTDGYRGIMSLTEDEGVRNKIVVALDSDAKAILIPGCGTKGCLERDITAKVESCWTVVCMDYEGVIRLAAATNKDSDKIRYEAGDLRTLTLCEAFDAVIVVNSILSGSHRDNCRMLSSCFNALKPGGKLIGFFPTILSAIEIAFIGQNPVWKDFIMANIDVDACTIKEPDSGQCQTFYTPLRLRNVFRDAGFRTFSAEIYYLDSPLLRQQAEEVYDIGCNKTDLAIYEHFVTAFK